MRSSVCPGCGLELPLGEVLPLDPRIGASAECYWLSLHVAAFELSHQALLGRFRQLTVAAYGAQHPGDPGKPIRLGYSLVGLHLALDRGFSGVQVGSPHGHAEACRAWAGAVWSWWTAAHDDVERLAQALLGDWPRGR
jgi:hypothetical protein